jgi:hypothetical protein
MAYQAVVPRGPLSQHHRADAPVRPCNHGVKKQRASVPFQEECIVPAGIKRNGTTRGMPQYRVMA